MTDAQTLEAIRIGHTNGILSPAPLERNPENTPRGMPEPLAGSRFSLAPPAAPPARRGGLPQQRTARRGAARRHLDRCLRMGDGSVSGVSGRQGLGTAGLKTLRGGTIVFLRGF
jgi:hypothetical protein